MNYDETVDWLFNQLPVYQVDGVFKYKVNLDPIVRLCSHLNNPHLNFHSIHVAGTNGKGSSSHMLSSILQEAGYKVGLYTSPHLKDFKERIKINGKLIDKQFVTDFVESNFDFFSSNNISFFEMTVAMAFDYFSKSKVDIAVIETGLGGRLDSTNIINPLVSLITNVGLDHQEFLGDSLSKIANEKAGIIKKNVPVVVSEYNEETFKVFKEKSKSLNTTVHIPEKNRSYETDLKGKFQNKNIAGVVKVISLLEKFDISHENIETGLLNIKKNTGILGRFQFLSKSPVIICDVGHNVEAFNEILKELEDIKFDRLRVVLGFVKGKNFEEVLKLFPKFTEFYFSSPNVSRALDLKEIKTYSKINNLNSKFYSSVKEAYISAKKDQNTNDLVFIGGSNFTVAEIL